MVELVEQEDDLSDYSRALMGEHEYEIPHAPVDRVSTETVDGPNYLHEIDQLEDDATLTGLQERLSEEHDRDYSEGKIKTDATALMDDGLLEMNRNSSDTIMDYELELTEKARRHLE